MGLGPPLWLEQDSSFLCVAVTMLSAPGSLLYFSQPSILQMKELGLERGGDLPRSG